MRDSQTWMPGDSESLQSWLDDHQQKESPDMRLLCGVDLGRVNDPSTVVVVEQRGSKFNQEDRHYYVHIVKRFPLGKLYSDVAAELSKLDMKLRVHAIQEKRTPIITWVLDSTGVGDAVSELVRRELPDSEIVKCYLTGGINPTLNEENLELHLPKQQLVSNLLSLFDAGLIHLSKESREIELVVEELRDFKISISDAGRESFAADTRVGAHDDLIIALGLSVTIGEMEIFAGIEMW
jgi:phage FluMu gp28-like protein